MSDPVGTSASLPPKWLDAAHARAAEFGFGQDLAGLGELRWQVVCQAVELTMPGREAPPSDWLDLLTRQAGRTPPAEQRQDVTDARLAEQGEVFAADDDA